MEKKVYIVYKCQFENGTVRMSSHPHPRYYVGTYSSKQYAEKVARKCQYVDGCYVVRASAMYPDSARTIYLNVL